jgi:transcriptional regulator with XRE-family HTH domain
MPEPLWVIRERKGMTINQLAARSGVPPISIGEYEAGQPIRSADLAKLARALYVEEWDIELKGRPRPKRKESDSVAASPAPQPRPKPAPAPEATRRRPPAPVKESQITHLLNLTTAHFGKDRAALESEIGKPLDQLTRFEASELLRRYQRMVAEPRSPGEPGSPTAKRRRAYLPESVDTFELQYLTAQQEAHALVRFTMFDGQQVAGRILGFGPYSITIRDAGTSEEITLQKLAIAYYRVAGGFDDDEADTGSKHIGGDQV